MKCRHCQAELTLSLIDLGTAPPSNAYLSEEKLHAPEKYFPLKVLVCEECFLVQTEDYAGANELFSEDYAYFSSFSTTWLKHAEKYIDEVTKRFELGCSSHVVEVAANDGYLLQYVKSRNIPCLGIEPTASTAKAARNKGIEVVEDFFGVALAKRLVSNGKKADLTVANNVLAHVPDINDFIKGFEVILKPQGVATFEFPHLLRLVTENQFDTIYHEHYSYLSLTAVKRVFESNGLKIFDVEMLSTHGGSLRVFSQRKNGGEHEETDNVAKILELESIQGMTDSKFYKGFQSRAEDIKNNFLSFLIDAKSKGKSVVGYGAAAKGNTLMNFAGIRSDLLSFVVDLNPAKQEKFLPGTRIPIVAEKHLKQTRPDYVVILPWNLKNEVVNQLEYIREWNGKFVVAIPEIEIL